MPIRKQGVIPLNYDENIFEVRVAYILLAGQNLADDFFVCSMLLFFYRFYYHSFARSLFAYFSSFRLFAIGLASIFPLSENSIHMMEFLTNNENNNSEFWIFNRKVVFTQHYHLHLMNILHSNCWWLILDIIDTRLMSNEKWVICINFLIKLMSLSLYN